MDAGKLNRRVRIEWMDPEAQDAFGQPVPAWVEITTVWASVRNRSGAESIKSDAETSIVRTSIRVRYRPGVEADMRATLLRYVNGLPTNEATYDIDAVLPDHANREFMDLICTEVGSGKR